jgi:uncharacterized protein with ATP-grasp and redox domains
VKIDPRCAACIRAEAEVVARAVGGRAGEKSAREGRAIAEALDPSSTPSVPLTKLHRAGVAAAGGKAPFEVARVRMREAARILVQHAERELAGAVDEAARLAIASRWAAAATHLDPRASGGLGDPLPTAEALAAQVLEIAAGPIVVDDTVIAWEIVRKARSVLFLHDGAAELALDRLVLIEIRRHAKRVFAGVSASPLAGRATADDLHRAGIDELVTEVLPVGAGEVGLVWEEATADLKGKLEVVDLVVAKGQANVYALHEREKEILKPIFCLFRTQCPPVSELFGATGRATVLKVWK